MASDFKLPRIGRRPIQSTAGAVAVRGEKGYIFFVIFLLSPIDTCNYSNYLYNGWHLAQHHSTCCFKLISPRFKGCKYTLYHKLKSEAHITEPNFV